MKKIKIFAFASHLTPERTGGVDFARVIQPMKALNGHTQDGYKFEVTLFDPKITGVVKDPSKILNYWVDIFKEHDILFFNYTTDPWGFAPMGAVARHYKRTLVLDLDDNLWNIQADNPAYDAFNKESKGIKNFTAIANEADYITTTNLYLKHAISHNTKHGQEDIFVEPNYVDLELYKYRNKFKDDGQIQLLHFGSTTHFIDLASKEFEKGIQRIMDRYPNVKLKTVGAFMPEYKQKWANRYENAYGDSDIYRWINNKMPDYMAESDILVTPLEDNKYTRCKSNIKFLEGSSYKIPGVWQKIRQYQETIIDGENGFLADTADEWYNSLSKLIEDAKLRKEMGEKAFNTVEKDWQMKNNLKVYADTFIQIFDKNKK